MMGMIETLEDRRLLSASIYEGCLWVKGTEGNDNYYISNSGSNVVVSENGKNISFARSAIKCIKIYLKGGDDSIKFGWGTMGAEIYGGYGNDVIRGSSSPDKINGGPGNDYLHAWAGTDQVWGEDGNDTIIGCIGNDTLWGGNGNDLMSGAGENDVLYGGAGNDSLYGAAGNDVIDGGDGYDISSRDGYDKFYNIAKVY